VAPSDDPQAGGAGGALTLAIFSCVFLAAKIRYANMYGFGASLSFGTSLRIIVFTITKLLQPSAAGSTSHGQVAAPATSTQVPTVHVSTHAQPSAAGQLSEQGSASHGQVAAPATSTQVPTVHVSASHGSSWERRRDAPSPSAGLGATRMHSVPARARGGEATGCWPTQPACVPPKTPTLGPAPQPTTRNPRTWQRHGACERGHQQELGHDHFGS
jgi:hypothetical protein